MKNAQIRHPDAPLKTKVNQARIRLKSEIVFGSLSTGCRGAGVCKVVPARVATEDWKCLHATAWISITPNQKIRFSFIKSTLTQQMIRRHFSWRLFQVFEPFPMPLFVEKKFKTDKGLTIKPGIYSVVETTTALIVDF